MRGNHIAFLALACFLASGCSDSEYNARYQATLQNITRDSNILRHIGRELTIADLKNKSTKVSIAIPKIFEQTAQPPDGNKELFSMIGRYEMADYNGEGPTLYVGATSKEGTTIAELMDKIEQGMKAKNPTVQCTRDDASYPGLNQTTSPTMPHLRITGEQVFTITDPVKGLKFAPVRGKTEVYFIEGPEHIVVLGFRGTDTALESQKFDAAMEASLGTVKIHEGQ